MKKIIYSLILILGIFFTFSDVNAALIPSHGEFECTYEIPYVDTDTNKTKRSFKLTIKRSDTTVSTDSDPTLDIKVQDNCTIDDLRLGDECNVQDENGNWTYCDDPCSSISGPAYRYNHYLQKEQSYIDYARFSITDFVDKGTWYCPAVIYSAVGVDDFSAAFYWNTEIGPNSFTTKMGNNKYNSTEAYLVEEESFWNDTQPGDKVTLETCSYYLQSMAATFTGISIGNSPYNFVTDLSSDLLDYQSAKQYSNATGQCPNTADLSFCASTNDKSWYITEGSVCDNGYELFRFAELDEEVKEDVNSGITTDDDSHVDVPKYKCDEPKCGFICDGTWGYIKNFYTIVKILVPALVILLGIIDFMKVVLSGEEKDMKKAGQTFLKRIIAGVVFILLPVLLEFLMELVGFSENCFQWLWK